MKEKEVLLLLTDEWGDWEPTYAIAEVNSVPQYTVKTIAEDKLPKESIGGLRTAIDYCVEDYHEFANVALIIMPGGFDWQKNEHPTIVKFLQEARESGVTIAAICGATIFLGRHGFLDSVTHTGDELSYFVKHEGYHGQEYFKEAQVVTDRDFITANETGALEFAYEIFKFLKIDTEDEINAWYKKFKYGMFYKDI